MRTKKHLPEKSEEGVDEGSRLKNHMAVHASHVFIGVAYVCFDSGYGSCDKTGNTGENYTAPIGVEYYRQKHAECQKHSSAIENEIKFFHIW